MSKWFQKNLGYPLNLDNPQTFNQKIQWLKLYDSTPEKARLADKLKVREWIEETIGGQYLIPIIGDGYKTFEEIDFSSLPDRFVLKTNHASGTNVIVKDKNALNMAETRLKFHKWLKTNYAFKMGFEFQYGMIPPRIICEQYMGNSLNDYKFFCFGGNPEFIQVDVGRYSNHCRNTYDFQWNELPFVIDRFDRVKLPNNTGKASALPQFICASK